MDVSLDKVAKSYGSNQVLKEVDLVFPSRKFTTLLGPSGCGKTTLLRMVAGLEPITAGTIRFGDKVVNKLAPRDRDIAMVFQSYALYPQMTLRKNLGYGLRVRGTPAAEINEAVERVARILEIDHLLDRKPAHLSGGQRQRVALGRAMVRRPNLFLMDEPLSNLDAKLRVTMRAELRRFHLDLNATTIYVTHDQLEAMSMSDLVAVMHAGAVQQFGTPAEVYGKPANLFVAGFIGSPPMNFLQGEITSSNSDRTFMSPTVSSKVPEWSEHLQTGQKVTLGIRPQDIEIVSDGTPADFVGRVWVVELLGSEKLLEIELDDKSRIKVQVRAEMDFDVDTIVRCRINRERAHLFDNQSGANLMR
ncbi:ABC transporter ATP-binding protein [Microbaculum marinisediminis]|uniref:Sn-glycerol-3-phosphate ABC transporter ATP-binding protein UgpC n=1 Tax=Microbaculum marinisediminis TaxID=2931392 RepID=A0AAW5R6H9_9HYPH|nr:sn-glycerol-3-phosphate ABC transporter ATP-binding protein UgpC [Microbaculum sp. A6E488]MCT8974239.1 sn-glycerol-3-phosphate ABC transporter ATP-binding protein UgpC [Microbaculum sp. A6E488]